MITDDMKAPWTDIQVENLKKWQSAYGVHPFTCCSPEDILQCQRVSNENEGILIPTNKGWMCPCGQYKQQWAHQYMLDGDIPPDWREKLNRK